MFLKTSSGVATLNPTTLEEWNTFKEAKLLTQQPTQEKNIIAMDKNAIYVHGTIVASVDLEPNSKFLILPQSEKFINDNGDCFPREEVLKNYPTFKSHARTYVEHQQGPEHAKGRCIDVVVRDMGDTVLVDVLFSVDLQYSDLVNNIQKRYVTHLSMGCQTEFTLCSICGNLAHNDKELCAHIKTQKKQIIAAPDGKMRKIAEVCYNNTWIDVSCVMNPAFAGAAIRKVLSSEDAKKVFANILQSPFETAYEYEKAILKAASTIVETPIVASTEDVNRIRQNIKSPTYDPYHPINNTTSDDTFPPEGFSELPWSNRHDIKESFDANNPGNESTRSGPMYTFAPGSDLTKYHACIKCGNKFLNITSTSDNSVLAKCANMKCGYVEEFNPGFKYKTAVRKQVIDILKNIIKQVKGKIVSQELVDKYAEGYRFLNKEIVDALAQQGYKVASKEVHLKTALQILESYSTPEELQIASNILNTYKFSSTKLDEAIRCFYSDEDSSEILINASTNDFLKKAVNKDNVEDGINFYISKVYEKMPKDNISEIIWGKYPLEAQTIMDEARKLGYR